MYFYWLSALSGALVAVMVVFNGTLSAYIGNYGAALVMQFVGLLGTGSLLLVRRKAKLLHLYGPWWLYTGGLWGLVTTICNNLSFGTISVAAILALNLTGQSFFSLLIDLLGLLGMPRRDFAPRKILGLALILLGVGLILKLQHSETPPLTAILCSLLSGMSVTLSRTINGTLAARSNIYISTFFNFAVGCTGAFILFIAAGGSSTLHMPPAWTIWGGIFSLVSILAGTAAVGRIPMFYLSLLVFIGQVFTGIVLDVLLEGSLSISKLGGGLCVAAGLALNLWFDSRLKQSSLSDHKHGEDCKRR